MQVSRENGKWVVRDFMGNTFGSYDSNAAAWRAVDVLTSQPLNRSQDVADWASRQVM